MQHEDMNTEIHPLEQSKHTFMGVVCTRVYPIFLLSLTDPPTLPISVSNRWLAARTGMQNKQRFLKKLALLC